MRELESGIAIEQTVYSRKPVVNVDIHEYDFPVGGLTSKLRFNDYDWHYVHKNATTLGAEACVTRQDTLILTDGDRVVRFEHPDLTTDFSAWAADGVPGFTPNNNLCIIANPISDEVMMFKSVPYTPYGSQFHDFYMWYRQSLDDGVTWTDWDIIRPCTGGGTPYDPRTGGAAYQPYSFGTLEVEQWMGVNGCYKPNGDIMLIAHGWDLRYAERISGSWDTYRGWFELGVMSYWPPTNAPGPIMYSIEQGDDVFTLKMRIKSANRCGTSVSYTTCPITIRNASLAYDPTFPGWIITWDKVQSNFDKDTGGFEQRMIAYTFYGVMSDQDMPGSLYTSISPMANWTFHPFVNYGMVNTVDATQDIHYASDITNDGRSVDITGHSDYVWMNLQGMDYSDPGAAAGAINNLTQVDTPFNQSQALKMGLKGWDSYKGKLLRHEYNINNLIQYPYADLHWPAGHELIMTTHSGGKNWFYHMREDLTIDNGSFYKATSFNNPFPLKLVTTTGYIIAFSGQQIYMSPLNNKWTAPTAGTGVGAGATVPVKRVLNIEEVVSGMETATQDITLNNHDGYFDYPGVGDVEHIKKGSRVSLHLGYIHNGSGVTMEYSRYFIDHWDHTRMPNRSLFVLHCVDGWGLLNDYYFPYQAKWNQFAGGTMTSIKDMIVLLVGAIGGSVTVETESAYLDTLYPKLTVAPNTRASEVLKRILSFVPDVIRFYGNDATISCPRTTDLSSYHYDFPAQ